MSLGSDEPPPPYMREEGEFESPPSSPTAKRFSACRSILTIRPLVYMVADAWFLAKAELWIRRRPNAIQCCES